MNKYTRYYWEGVTFYHDGFELGQCSYSQASDEFGEFAEGYSAAKRGAEAE